MPTIRCERVKAAAGDRKAFETALASMGRSAIASLAPAVAKYEIGFQVLDQDDDNYVAVGVFGFKLGKRLYYVPMFYRDGVIKGIEQLRDPKRNLAVPLSDNWVNKFLADAGDDNGTRVPKSRIAGTAQPSLWQLKYPPTKYGSAPAPVSHREWTAAVEEFKRDLARPMTRAGGWFESPDLLKEAAAEPAVMSEVSRLVTTYPWFARAVETFYGWDKLASAADAAAVVATERAAPPPLREVVRAPARTVKSAARLAVIRVSTMHIEPGRLSQVMEDFDHTAAERNELFSGKNAYRDDRSDDSVTVVEAAAGGPGGGTALENPNISGVYHVLGEDMKLHSCAVFFPLVSFNEVPGACCIVRLSDGAYHAGARTAIWMVSGPPDLRAAREWYDGLPKAADAPSGKRVLAVHLAMGDHLVASAPFTLGDNGAWMSPAAYDDPYWSRMGYRLSTDPGRDPEGPGRVRVLDTAGHLTTQSNVLYLPATSRYVTLEGKERFRPAYGDDPERFLAPTVKAAADRTASGERRAVLTVERLRHGYSLDVGYGSGPVKSAADVEADLVEYLGLRPAVARSLLALSSAGRPAVAVVKFAGPYGPGNLPHDYPNAPPIDDQQLVTPGSFADDVVPSERAATLALTVQDLMPEAGSTDRYRPYPTDYGVSVPMGGIGNGADSGGSGSGGDRDGGDDKGDVTRMSRAAGSGIKELFDTASLSAIVKRKSVARVVDKLTRSSMKAMNASADALCHLYWNPDEWAERYGQAEIGPVEDQLADQFKNMGELYLTLQEKAVDSGRDFGILPGLDTVDASDAAGG